jgi:signal transduction histidine kinase
LAALAALGFLWHANRRLKAAHAREKTARRVAQEAVAARGRILANLSHELRSAAGALTSGTRLIQSSADPALQQRLLAAMHDSGRQMLSLLESMLEHERQLAAGTVLKPSEQSLAAWWDALLAPLRIGAIDKGLALREEPPADHILRFDGVRLGQVLGNLVQNAIRTASSCDCACETRGPECPTVNARRSSSPIAKARRRRRLARVRAWAWPSPGGSLTP